MLVCDNKFSKEEKFSDITKYSDNKMVVLLLLAI